jgi:hypothetical protein
MEFIRKDGIFIIVDARLVNRRHPILFNCRHHGIALTIVLPDLNFRRVLNPVMRNQVDKILVSNRIFQLDRRQPQPLFYVSMDGDGNKNKFVMSTHSEDRRPGLCVCVCVCVIDML